MELIIAFLLFLIVVFGVTYNIARRQTNPLNKQAPTQPDPISPEKLISKIQDGGGTPLGPEYTGVYHLLKKDLSDSSGNLIFEKIFKWEQNDNCYTLVYSPIYKDMKLHFYNFYVVNTGSRHISIGEEINLDADYYSFGKISSVKSPVEGIMRYLLPPMISANIKSGCNILTIDTSKYAIDEYEHELAEKSIRNKELDIQAEKNRIAEQILRRQMKHELEKEVRQELIDNGKLFGDAPKRPRIPQEVVDAVYRRDGGRCVYCGSTENLQLDHIIPFSRGGATNVDNLQLLCQKCNLAKSNKIG